MADKDPKEKVRAILGQNNSPYVAALHRAFLTSDHKPNGQTRVDMSVLTGAARELCGAVQDMSAVLDADSVTGKISVTGVLGVCLVGAYWSGYKCAMREMFGAEKHGEYIN